MNSLLKIVEGPNRGAEITLVEGVEVSFGKSVDCDVVLADRTFSDDAVKICAAPDGVTVDGEALEQYHVKTLGATSFAVGPEDAEWGELVWPQVEPHAASGEAQDAGAAGKASGGAKEEGARADAKDKPSEKDGREKPEEEKGAKRGIGCVLALVLLIAILVLLALLGYKKRDRVREYYYRVKDGVVERFSKEKEPAVLAPTIEDVIAKYSLKQGDDGTISGNFETRAERLAATAEAYAAKPGAALDLSDDESLKTAAEDVLALLGEKRLKVAAAKNRVVTLEGRAADLRRLLEAMNAEIAKLENVDCTKVTGATGAGLAAADGGDAGGGDGADAFALPSSMLGRRKAPGKPQLPVCGILVKPYPCLVLKNGARVMEGAPFGEWQVVKISADSVTLEGPQGRYVWKP